MSCDAWAAAFRPLPKSMQHFQIKFRGILCNYACDCGGMWWLFVRVAWVSGQRSGKRRVGKGSAGAGARVCILHFHLISFAAIQICSCFPLHFFLGFLLFTGRPLVPLQLNYDTTGCEHTHTRTHTHTHRDAAAAVKLAHNMEKSFASFTHQHQRACWAHVKHSNAIC